MGIRITTPMFVKKRGAMDSMDAETAVPLLFVGYSLIACFAVAAVIFGVQGHSYPLLSGGLFVAGLQIGLSIWGNCWLERQEEQ